MKKIAFQLLLIITFLASCNAQQNLNTISIIDTETLKVALSNKTIQLIDVRTPLEYKQGYIGNAINANIYTSDFTQATALLDKTKPVYVYCHKGGRSNAAARKLTKLGFNKIFDFKGGWKAWKNSLKQKN